MGWKTLYIFCGDYLERGIENKEMIYEVMRLSTLPNTIMLEVITNDILQTLHSIQT